MRQFVMRQKLKEPDISNTVVLIIVAIVVVLLLILGFAFVARSARDKKRRAESGRIKRAEHDQQPHRVN